MSSKILLLNSKTVKAVLKSHPALQGKKLIASGMFSGVYEGSSPDTVLKLTICPGTRQILTDEKLGQSIHAPKLIQDYGIVGEFMTGTNIVETKNTKPVKKLVPMYLIEIERLEKLPKNDNRKIATHISKALQYAISITADGESFTSNQTNALRTLSKESKLIGGNQSIGDYFERLIAFVEGNSNVFYDMHTANMMQRTDGTLIFSDPIGSSDIFETQGIFAGLRNSDVQWSEVQRDHQERFGYLKRVSHAALQP